MLHIKRNKPSQQDEHELEEKVSDLKEDTKDTNDLGINSWISDGFEFVEQAIPLEVVDESYYLSSTSSDTNFDITSNNTSDKANGTEEDNKDENTSSGESLEVNNAEVDEDIVENFESDGVFILTSGGNTLNNETIKVVACEEINNTSSEELLESSDLLITDDGTLIETNKSLKMYYIFCGVCLSLVLFFGVSYLIWFLDNRNVNGVVNGLISETTSKHNMTVTDNKVIEDIQIGQVYDFLEVDFEPLIERNSDTQGYLKIKAIDGLEYPVMQTMDNEYYLDKDIDRNKSGAGWLFADCRNSLDFMQFNTIIYGHNRVDGLMFGNLKQLMKSEINSKPDADKIYFNTRNGQMIYEICSIYVTTYDDWEYYDVDFSEEGKQRFIERLNKLNQVLVFKRSDLSTMDNFITLSTCHGSAGTEKRLVVHARLVAMK